MKEAREAIKKSGCVSDQRSARILNSPTPEASDEKEAGCKQHRKQ
jgi:hypothetical protein